MNDLHLLAGSNGAGKTTFYERVLGPATGLRFVNADAIARDLADGRDVTEAVSIEASRRAAQERTRLIQDGISFVAETVFSHPSKVELVRAAGASGFAVHLHVVVVPLGLTMARVDTRVINGGHDVPRDRIRPRYERLWPLVAEAIELADDATVYDNSRARHPFRVIARYEAGLPIPCAEAWPAWAPEVLRPAATSSERAEGQGGGRR